MENPMKYQVAAFYKFVLLDDLSGIHTHVKALAARFDLRGTILLADEGINSTIAGLPDNVQGFFKALRILAPFADLEVKFSEASEMPFYRMKVRLKKEIVTLGIAGISPRKTVGTYVKPDAWNALIADPDTIVIDTRNDYEVALGRFKGAVDPNTQSFRQFPAYVKQNLEASKKKRVAMYCTGGIRCEKASSYMLEQGFEEVYHLEGGILKYLETVKPKDSLWQGECFVFDMRTAVADGLKEGESVLCFGCRAPLKPADQASPHYINGLQCPRCYQDTDPKRRGRAAERHKQVMLAKERGVRHIGR